MFKGSFVAVITPLNKDESINFPKLTEILNWHVEQGTDGIAITGTTGEAATMTISEQLLVIKHAVDVIDKRIPVIAGTGSNNTREGLELSLGAEQCGVDGIFIVNPYYNKGNDDGIYYHYKKINDAVNVPIMLYNVPSRTGNCMSFELIKRLATLEHIVGIKEASGNLDVVKQITNEIPGFVVFSGNDDQIVDVIERGGCGVVSVCANIIPKATSEIVALANQGLIEEARKKHDVYLSLIDALFIEVNPIPVKEALNIMGKEVGGYRLPLYPMREDHLEVLKNEMKKVM